MRRLALALWLAAGPALAQPAGLKPEPGTPSASGYDARVMQSFEAAERFQGPLDGGWTLHSHLRMDGAWHLYAPGERWRGGAEHQVRAVLGNEERTAVGYRLPVLELLPTADESQAVGHLGPDLLGSGWDPAAALARLTAGPQRPVGEAADLQRLR